MACHGMPWCLCEIVDKLHAILGDTDGAASVVHVTLRCVRVKIDSSELGF